MSTILTSEFVQPTDNTNFSEDFIQLKPVFGKIQIICQNLRFSSDIPCLHNFLIEQDI